MLTLKKTIVAVLFILMSTVSAVGTVVASEPNTVYVDLSNSSTSVIPGQSASLEVGIPSAALPDTKGIQAAKITLSYDENVFTTDGLLRYDDALGKYIWRDDCFTLIRPYDNGNYRIENPYPTDLNPSDNKKEIVIYVSGNKDKWLSSDSGVPFVHLFLNAKEIVSDSNTSITVRMENTELQDQDGNDYKNYTSTSAKIYVGLPRKIDIVRGTLPPSSQAISMELNQGMEVNALALFANGDTTYVTEIAKWESSNPDVVAVKAYGSISGVSYGKAILTATVGSLVGSHEVVVGSRTEKEKYAQPDFNVSVTYVPSSDISQKAPRFPVFVNGKSAEEGLLVDGSMYVPLSSVGRLLMLPVGYDSSKKVPTLAGRAVSQFKVFAGTSYIKARDIPVVLPGAKTYWDTKNKILSIEYLI
ncbi:hypothetical protein [Paenibacillus polymyxa]|uniref:hypothetical protein n=1 Tax=Paenibacillus polymyxa TaxID=1406 RepID=UPI000F4E301E|nr:hypothetical protein [Paenibacillus polymyxa]RPE03283.1 hypothetical protein EG487_14915 [Paenibacillus polymyxa]